MLGTLLMSNAFDAITNSITREFKRLRFAVLGKVHYLLRTGNMKFSFDRMYLENRDPWNYRYSKYERDKYDGTLGCALAWRNGQVGALELGRSAPGGDGDRRLRARRTRRGAVLGRNGRDGMSVAAG